MKTVKALLLFSGGLDSSLAAKLLTEQGVDTTALCFVSNFFNAEKAKEMAEKLNFKLRIENISEDELNLVKNPPNGYGKNMNPCIDCHTMMIKKAGEIAKGEGFDFIATGEVLGQRPFSQNRQALMRVAELAGVEVLRPLSAKNLEETEIEKKGLVRRGPLKAIKGRQREAQLALAKRFKIKDFPSPSGGCILTDQKYSERFMKMLDYWPKCGVDDVSLLSLGRVFWLNDKSNNKILLIIGRNHEENEALKKLAKKGDIMVELKEINGPTALIRGGYVFELKNKEFELDIPEKLKMSVLNLPEIKESSQIFNIAAKMTGYYSLKARNKKVKLIFKII
ncbi:MAG: asparagine synthase-related protein [Patescibacteria group bacterium]|nr:asparagine synthase-related protein [Patescibacteria group bacterium]